MIKNTKYALVFALLLVIGSCKKNKYSMGDLTAPSEIVITTSIAGVISTNGDVRECQGSRRKIDPSAATT